MDQSEVSGESTMSGTGDDHAVGGAPGEATVQERPWWRSPLAAVAGALLVMGALVLVINLASGSGGDSDTSVSSEAAELDDEPAPASTEPERSDCELMAESIFNDMDAGYSTPDIYASYGGVQDPDTAHFINVYLQWRAWSIQLGRDEALQRVVDDVAAWCSGGAIKAPTDEDYGY